MRLVVGKRPRLLMARGAREGAVDREPGVSRTDAAELDLLGRHRVSTGSTGRGNPRGNCQVYTGAGWASVVALPPAQARARTEAATMVRIISGCLPLGRGKSCIGRLFGGPNHDHTRTPSLRETPWTGGDAELT